MNDPVHLNARADECSAAVMEHGQRIVRYQGEGYVIVGFYFARGDNGQRDLYYILRPPNGSDQNNLSRDPRREMHKDDRLLDR